MRQCIGFYLNGGEYTIPIMEVQEIINMPSITTMPSAPEYIEGVTTLRGRVIPVVDLKRLIHLGAGDGKGDKVIVMSGGNQIFGAIVDAISGVINIDESQVEPCHGVLEAQTAQVEGVARLADRLVIILNPRKLIPGEDLGVTADYESITETDDGEKVEVTKTVLSMAGEMKITEVHDAREFYAKSGIPAHDPKYLLFDDILAFMTAIGGKDYDKAEEAIEAIIRKGQNNLYMEVGKVTRKLHDSVLSFKESLDPRLREITEQEMPSVVERLNHVIDKTREAADCTMGVAEKHLMAMEKLDESLRALDGPEEAVTYLKDFRNNLEDDLIKIITAQSFQDLTGQTLKKVIALVNDIEAELVRVIKTFGISVQPERKEEVAKVSQSEVDDLLKELGF